MKPAWTLAFSLFGLILAGSALGQDGVLVDRVVAVVDEEPILESDLSRVVGLGLVEPLEGESEDVYRRRVLDQVIEEKLRFHEIDRFGFSELSLVDVERAFDEIRSRFGSDEDFTRRLEDLEMTADDLRQLVARQLMVLTYVDERLGSRVFVSADDIQRYFDETLVPELRASGQEIPSVSSVREQIRTVLRQQRLNDEIRRWTEELRLEADIEDYFSKTVGAAPVVLGSDEG